jgi:hypothetical protein
MHNGLYFTWQAQPSDEVLVYCSHHPGFLADEDGIDAHLIHFHEESSIDRSSVLPILHDPGTIGDHS